MQEEAREVCRSTHCYSAAATECKSNPPDRRWSFSLGREAAPTLPTVITLSGGSASRAPHSEPLKARATEAHPHPRRAPSTPPKSGYECKSYYRSVLLTTCCSSSASSSPSSPPHHHSTSSSQAMKQPCGLPCPPHLLRVSVIPIVY